MARADRKCELHAVGRWGGSGCSGTHFGKTDMGIAQFRNGHYSDEDAYAVGNMFTTGRIAVVLE